jgi:plastocyanin domain-containing protein
MSRFVLVVALALSLVACTKADKAKDKSAPATTATGTVGADGVRRIPIEANEKGYVPDKIPGKPGEKIVLVFTRTIDSECLAELKTPEGKVVPLPMNKPVEVAITVPETGKLTFACGMDMFQGAIVTDI